MTGFFVSITGVVTPPAEGCSTSMISISGAASRIAFSTAIWSVIVDDGHPSQLPSSRSFTAFAAVSMSTSSTSPLCGTEHGTHCVERSFDPRLERRGVQAVHHEQAADELVGREPIDQAR